MLKKYFKVDTRIILLVLILIEFLFNIVLKNMMLSEKVLYQTLASEMTLEQIETGLEASQSFSWVLYLLLPISIILSIVVISLCLNIGALLLSYKISFKSIFGVVTKAFILFSISKLILLGMLGIWGMERWGDLAYIPSFSIYDLVDKDAIAQWMVYPLQMISIFQLLFILLIAMGLNYILKKGVRHWVIFTLCTYGLAIIIWVSFITFFIFL